MPTVQDAAWEMARPLRQTPPAAENLILLNELKLAAAVPNITSVEVKDEKVMLKRGGDYILLGTKFPRLTATEPAARLRELLKLVRSL